MELGYKLHLQEYYAIKKGNIVYKIVNRKIVLGQKQE